MHLLDALRASAFLSLGLFSYVSAQDAPPVDAIGAISDTIDKFLGPVSTILGIVDFIGGLIDTPNEMTGTIVQIGTNAAVDAVSAFKLSVALPLP